MHQPSGNHAQSQREIPPTSAISDLEPLDTDTPPGRYLLSGNPSSQGTSPDNASSRHSTTATMSSDRRRSPVVPSRSKQPSRPRGPHQQQSSRQRSTPKKRSSGILGWLTGTTRPDSIDADVEQPIRTQEDKVNELMKLLNEKEEELKWTSEEHLKDKASEAQRFDDEWQRRENELQQKYRPLNETNQTLQLQVLELASQRNEMQEKHNSLFRRQQEESFKQMGTGRWLPGEESRVQGDFERIRTQMRVWVKTAAIKNLAAIQDIEEDQRTSLMASLSCVLVFENNQLPRGLSTSKGPSILLNALLAHDVYVSLFGDPFFFLNGNLSSKHGPVGDGLDNSLSKICNLALASNVENAHIWRSQTLRLLLPPIGAGSTDGERSLHQWTEGMIAKAAELCASRFAASSARHLVNTVSIEKLNSIYREAASVSYILWTRKTAMKLETLSTLGSPLFDVDDPRLKPHPVVHPDDYDDKLKGRQIKLIVHPLLRVYGTDDGKGYEEARVWVPAEVWFETK